MTKFEEFICDFFEVDEDYIKEQFNNWLEGIKTTHWDELDRWAAENLAKVFENLDNIKHE